MDYFVGVDALGADDVLGAANSQGPFVTIHVKNLPEVVKKKGGSTGAAALSLVPQTVENAAYADIAAKIGAGMKQEGVDADIQVVSSKPAFGGSPKDLAVGAVVGASAFGLVFGLVKLFKK